MKKSENQDLGDMIISYRKHEYDTPLTVSVQSLHMDDFMTFVNAAVNTVSGEINSVITDIPKHAKPSKAFFGTTAKIESNECGIITHEEIADEPVKNETTADITMSDLNRNEMQALLKANKSEVDAVASRMQSEMAKWRELMTSDMKDIKNLVSSQYDNINSRLDIQSVRIEAALDSHSKKIDASLAIQEAKIEGKLSDVKLDIIKWALGIPALAFTVYKLYGAISGNPTP
ncbi:TPA: DUF1640 domain-containing protein [Yersinia enterocolitica]|uniref:DUF1640 domain-containing protein n=1 Tax=Yersinia enterocolitica TaxID=630 RepID=UPI0021E86BA1|nr:DUF1640 domain-containing protein [Yersinia enterocolitica]EKN4883331.1 DUF1640 domain-containing protein [Yersinia enterocolitica]EKN6093765.1 DUF1640 domain-containing protein [Yersinia enterocolitica]UYJ82702.1 DUF1640 domain-containing protein [Yersinia enterocolitica]HDL6643251.1 DUF1640 domain-containing protein [Yersinia enterocolitica]HDL7805394.1 DUF1640 domain-containing protein [Yersinia enterocolitica]